MCVISRPLRESDILKNFGGKKKNNLNNIIAAEELDCDVDLSSYSPYVSQEGLPDYIGDFKGNFSLFSLNSQSIHAKMDKLKVVLEDLSDKNVNFSLISLQESWLKGDPNHNNEVDLSHFELNGYKSFATGATCSAHGGVISYVKDSFDADVKLKFSSKYFDAIFLEIRGQDIKPFIFGNIYRSPKNDNSSVQGFLREFSPIITDLCKDNKNIILSGDFNLNLILANQRELYGQFLDLLLSLGLCPKITYPTRFAKYSASLLDLIFVRTNNGLLSKTKNGILHSTLSDHCGCFTFLDNPIKNYSPPKYVEIQKEDENSVKLLIESLSNSNLNEKINLELTSDPNLTYSQIESEIQLHVNKHLPIKRIRFNKYKHKKTPWITTGILTSMRFRDNLYRKWKAHAPNSTAYETYRTNFNTYSKIINKLIKDAKFKYYNHEFDKYKSDIKKTWRTINSILNRNRKVNNFPAYIMTSNGKISDKQQIANKLNDYFSNIGQSLASKIPKSNKHFSNFLKTRVLTSFSFNLVMSDDVIKVVNSCKPKTSKGVDGISMKLFKSILLTIVNPITTLINQSLTTGVFPTKLKIAKIMPLMKKPNNYHIDNFRPISLLPCISKVIEKCVFNQLYSYFESNKLLYKSQYGYRKAHSTETACLELVDKLSQDLDRKKNPLCIFIDLSKAFDTLDHSILLAKLQHYGLNNCAINWFSSYLSNRQQFVEIDGHSSNLNNINTGVPQGSTLGPLLFIIYMNDINEVSSIFEAILFADDTSLTSTLSLFSDPQNNRFSENINLELHKISEWMRVNKLSLNISKTKYMIFRYSQRSPNTIPKLHLKIENTTIEKVQSFNFLGLTVNENLSWKDHINNIGRIISKTIGIMRRVKRLVNSSILLKIYNSLILSRFHYGILCWGFDCHNLFNLQKKAIRVIYKTKYNSHTDPLFKKANLLKIKDIFQVQCLKFFFNYKNNKVPDYFQDTFSFPTATHRYGTRNRLLYQTSRTNSKASDKTLRNHIPGLLNKTPNSLLDKITTHSIDSFKNRIKSFYIDKYISTCEKARCYVCSR